MSKSFSARHDIAAAVAPTGSAITSERWPEAVARELHDDSRVVSREQTPQGGVVLVHSRALPDGIPSFLQKFLPKDGRVIQTDTWDPPAADGGWHGDWEVVLPGAPAELRGTTSVVPDGDASAWTIEGTVKVKVPLIGGKTESFLVDMLSKLTARQAEVLRELAASR